MAYEGNAEGCLERQAAWLRRCASAIAARSPEQAGRLFSTGLQAQNSRPWPWGWNGRRRGRHGHAGNGLSMMP